MKLFSIFRRKTNKTSYKCRCCGEEYEEIPLCFGSDFPDYYYSIPPEERDKRVELTESLCVIDEEHFFHRGRMIIPINDYKEGLVWNVWTSISKENFINRNDSWNDPDRVKEGPYFGWLQTTIPTYLETLNIKTMAYEQEVGYIPEIKSIEENHPLTLDQEKGISLKKALSIVDVVMRGLHEKE